MIGYLVDIIFNISFLSDDIIKMSKNGTNANKGKKQRIPVRDLLFDVFRTLFYIVF